MEIETIEVFGFISALKALRLPFGKPELSDSVFKNNVKIESGKFVTNSNVLVGKKDLKLLQTLILRGDEHAKVVRGICASCLIKAPRYWWQEFDTYRIGCERLSSESTMHIQSKGMSGKELQEYKANIKEGLEQTRIQVISYQTLRRMYFQRKNHRLPEWHQYVDWIRNLPLSNELITIERNENEKLD